MTIYAVIKTGGKEYRVAQGDVVRVAKLEAAPGDTVEIREVSSIETAKGVTVGSPTVADARVIAEVIEEGHGEKILIFKKKRRDHYQMMSGDLQSYSALRIREIAVGESVYAAAVPRRDVAAAATPPPPPPRISKPQRKVVEPPPPAPIEQAPPVAVYGDAPVALMAASEERVATQPQSPQPSSDGVHPEIPRARVIPLPRVEIAEPATALAEPGPRKRSHRLAALVAGLVVIAAGLLLWGSREPLAPGAVAAEVATVAAPPQAAQPSVPPPGAKPASRKELAVKKTAAASAPSAPVQPPE
jgi:large subunit ribosomal protein L21